MDQVRVIIEAKGCWNRLIETAMKAQLVDRYLKDNRCRHGIYLVGWYNCKQWNAKDRQKSKTSNWSLEEAKSFFEKQAQESSVDDIEIRAVVINAALR